MALYDEAAFTGSGAAKPISGNRQRVYQSAASELEGIVVSVCDVFYAVCREPEIKTSWRQAVDKRSGQSAVGSRQWAVDSEQYEDWLSHC